MKEKQFFRSFIFHAAIIIAVFFLVWMISALTLSKDYSEPLFSVELQEETGIHSKVDAQIEFEPEGILTLSDVYDVDGVIWITLTPLKAGKVTMNLVTKINGETCVAESSELTVSPDGTITDRYTGNFSHYRLYHFYLVLLGMTLSILAWGAFFRSSRKLGYSYQSIFFSGLAMWLTLITLLLMSTWLRNGNMKETYLILQSGAYNFILYSMPFTCVFGVAMTISNISLIRHEGFRFPNALGIIISVLVTGGSLLGVMMEDWAAPATDIGKNLFQIFVNIYDVIFAYMECFLIGAILCGTFAALHRPAYNKDYIIILGCKVRPDGTLYPLIRGRVDKAIAFYRKQLEKTGKKAIFVPSGGQGSDETLSEAAAMKRYLLDQGIGEEQILVEDQSGNTLENMRFSKKLIDERTPGAKVAFSTTNFHVFRSGIISRKCDFEPDGMGSKTKWYFWPNAYMREAIGMLSYKWKAMTLMLIPIFAFVVVVERMY